MKRHTGAAYTCNALIPALYPRVLGSSWLELAAAVRRAHLNPGEVSLRGTGSFQVRHGTGRPGRLLAWLLRMPPATETAKTRLVVTPLGRGERWERSFDDRFLVTTQREAREGGLIERFGMLELRFRLEVQDGALLFRQVGAELRSGPLHFPIPQRLAPRVEAWEEGAGPDTTHVGVAVTVPVIGRLISYEGHIRREVPR